MANKSDKLSPSDLLKMIWDMKNENRILYNEIVAFQSLISDYALQLSLLEDSESKKN